MAGATFDEMERRANLSRPRDLVGLKVFDTDQAILKPNIIATNKK